MNEVICDLDWKIFSKCFEWINDAIGIDAGYNVELAFDSHPITALYDGCESAIEQEVVSG